MHDEKDRLPTEPEGRVPDRRVREHKGPEVGLSYVYLRKRKKVRLVRHVKEGVSRVDEIREVHRGQITRSLNPTMRRLDFTSGEVGNYRSG